MNAVIHSNVASFRRRVRQRIQSSPCSRGNEIELAKSELATIERRLRKIVDAIADGVPARTLKDELLALVARQDELRELLARPEPDRTLIHPGLAEIYRRRIAALHEAVEDEATREEAMELIRSLIEAIVLIPDGGLRIEVRGDLAAILALGEGRKNPGRVDRDSAQQIKEVAGVRFVQERTGRALRKLV